MLNDASVISRRVRPQQVDLWVRMGGTPFPHIHKYILQDQAGSWWTQLQILDLPVLEMDPLNFQKKKKELIFHQPKGCFPPDRNKKSRNLPYK